MEPQREIKVPPVYLPDIEWPNPMPTTVTNVAPVTMVILGKKQAMILLSLLGMLNGLLITGLFFLILVFAKLIEIATLLYILGAR